MALFDLIELARFTADSCCNDSVDSCCQGSAFTAIAAAFSTQGYWVQSDIIEFMTYDGSQAMAVLIYMMGAIGGLISMALGMPPKNYLWFFMGPGLFHWLLGSPIETKGVLWQVGDQPQDQREVWKLSEPGLVNMWRVRDGTITVSRSEEPSAPIKVAMPFVWMDSIVSHSFNSMISWFGMYERKGNPSGSNETNVIKPTGGNYGTGNSSAWHLLSKLKWGYVENITAAKLSSSDLRDSFVNFLSNECGDALVKQIDEPKFIAATKSTGKSLPSTIFRDGEKGGTGAYRSLRITLANTIVPTPRALKNLLENDSAGSFSKSFKWYDDKTLSDPTFTSRFGDEINCDTYLHIVISGFRWESGHIYNQIIQSLPTVLKTDGSGTSTELAMTGDDLVMNLFLGWDVKVWTAVYLPYAGQVNLPVGKPNSTQLQDFLKDLILVHLFRNELRLAPPLKKEMRFTSKEELERDSGLSLATQTSKAKYGELYTWALMTPYLQGVMLYLLAIAYPFACILLLVPGWHKAILTWLSFWAWVKMWDVGFAIVLVLEQSIWAVVGNGSNAAKFWAWITQMQLTTFGGRVEVKCDSMPCKFNDIPNVFVGDGATDASKPLDWIKSLRIFDRSILVGSASDLDLQNGYYIYIMAALYMAVPAVCGQLVLGARAGAAGMVNNMIGGVAQSGGQGAGEGYKGGLNARLGQNKAAFDQGKHSSAMRTSGLGVGAMEMGNRHADSQLAGSYANAQASGVQAQQRQMANRKGVELDGIQTGSDAFKLGSTAAGAGGALALTLDGMVKGMIDAGKEDGKGPGKSGAPSSAGAPGGRRMGTSAGASGGGAAGSSAGGDFGGASGGGAAGGGASGFGGPSGSKLTDLLGNAKVAAFDWAKQIGANKVNRSYAAADAAMNAQQAEFGIGGFKAGGDAIGLGVGSGRAKENAGFVADTAKQEAGVGWANASSGMIAALGGNAGIIQPGQKPQSIEGYAANGMLGKKGKSAFDYTDATGGGGFFGKVSSNAGNLQSNYGGNAIMSAYQDTNPIKAFGAAVNDARAMVTPGDGKKGNIMDIIKNPSLGYSQPPAQTIGTGSGGKAPAAPKATDTGQYKLNK